MQVFVAALQTGSDGFSHSAFVTHSTQAPACVPLAAQTPVAQSVSPLHDRQPPVAVSQIGALPEHCESDVQPSAVQH